VEKVVKGGKVRFLEQVIDSVGTILFKTVSYSPFRFDILDIDRENEWRGHETGPAPFLFAGQNMARRKREYRYQYQCEGLAGSGLGRPLLNLRTKNS
jgi:hypothetical protein